MTYNDTVIYLEKEIKDRKLGYEYFLAQGHYPDENKAKEIAKIQDIDNLVKEMTEETP